MSIGDSVCEKDMDRCALPQSAAHKAGMTMKKKTPVLHSTDSTALCEVLWIAADGNSRDAIATPRLLGEELYLAKKIRTGNRYPKQRNYHGHNWFGNTQQQIWFESLFERHALLWLDHTRDIVAIASQPMTMTFGDGSEHTPDFIALLSDHSQMCTTSNPPAWSRRHRPSSTRPPRSAGRSAGGSKFSPTFPASCTSTSTG